MLGCLCLAAGARVSRGAPRRDAVGSRAGFSGTRQLPPGLPRACRRIRAACRMTLISADRETIAAQDGRLLDRRAALLSGDPEPQKRARSELAALCKGDLLEELDGVSASFDQWLLERALALHRAAARAARRGAEHARSESRTASRACRGNCAPSDPMFDPTHEGASRVLMRALADMGERAQALREYGRCREALKRAWTSSRHRKRARSTKRSACSAATRRGRDAEPARPRPASGGRRRRAGGRQAQSPARRGAAVSCRPARRATTARAFAQPGDRRRARALPLVRRDRADGADAGRRRRPDQRRHRCGRTSWTM